MTFHKPTEELIKKAFPEISELSFIASGGFKGVYKAKFNGNLQALKLINVPEVPLADAESVRMRDELIRRVEREIEILKKCKSECIVKLGTLSPCGKDIEGKKFIAYSEEFLEGKNLWDLLRDATTPKPSEEELKTLLRALLEAIKEFWQYGIIHRDIKPCNIIRTGNAARPFVLLDLGIAFSRVDTPLTQGWTPATYRYFAPEMANPSFRDSLDYRADLYTSALTVYEYAAKVHPLAKDFEDPIVTVSRAVRVPPASLKSVRQDLSDDFCDLIDKLLNKIPALRPGNMAMLMKRIGG